jgi:hypothetical protein
VEETALPKTAEAWTPYGLEHIRIAHIRRRRLLTLLALLALLGLLLLLFSTTTEKSTEIFANGNQVGANGIQIEDREQKDQKDHVTVAIEPGKVSRAETGDELEGDTITRGSLPLAQRAAPYNWNYYLLNYGPYLLLLLAAWLLAKKRGKYDQVNFGVYKGAMPLEMLTASHDRHVFTRKRAIKGVFGKGRSDYLPGEIMKIEPVQEEAE